MHATTPPLRPCTPTRRAPLSAQLLWIALAMGCAQDPEPAAAPLSSRDAAQPTYSSGPCAFEVAARPGWRRECGVVHVPHLRHAVGAPQTALQTLPLYVEQLRPEGDDDDQTPLLYLTGGSGFSLLDYALGIGIIPKLYASTTRRVILVEQRGNALSPGCDQAQSSEACAAQLTQRGVVLEALNSLESADDVADVLRALKQERAILWGHSYGSGLAMRVAQRHPERVQGLILEGVSHPRGYQEPLELPHYLQVAQGFSAWFNPRCAADSACAEVFPEGIDAQAELTTFASSPQLNVPITAQFMLTGELIFAWGVGGGQGLYEGMLMFVQLLHAANAHRAGRPQVLERLLTLWGDGDRDAGAQRLVALATTLTTQSPSFELSHTIKGCFDVLGLWEQDPACASLDRALYPAERLDFSLQTSAPTLYLQGHLDTQTPLREGELLAPKLQALQVVTFEQCIGHMPFRDGGDCAPQVIAQWLDDPSRAPSPACMASVCQDKPLLPSGALWGSSLGAQGGL